MAAISEDNAEAVLGLAGCTFDLSGHVESDASLNGDKPGMPMVSVPPWHCLTKGSMAGIVDRVSSIPNTTS